MINIKCLICKKSFYIKPSQKKRGKKFCSKKCYTKAQIGQKHKPCSIETKNKIYKKAIQRWENSKFRKKSIEAMKKGRNNPQYKAKMKKYWASKEFRKRMSKIVPKGKNHHNWNNHQWIHRGYIMLFTPKHPFANAHGYVRKSRLVIEKQIKRYLLPTERVHHINKIKTDNRIKNLMAFKSHSAHRRFECGKSIVKPEEIIFNGRKFIPHS